MPFPMTASQGEEHGECELHDSGLVASGHFIGLSKIERIQNLCGGRDAKIDLMWFR